MKKIILILIISQFFSISGQAQWYTQQSGMTSALYDIEFINRNTGWACGVEGIIKTTNGGINWVRQSNGVPFEPLFGISPVDSNFVYAVGFFRTYIKSTNGGSSWFNLDSGMQGDGTYQSVFFLNSKTGWAGYGDGTFFGVRKTTDGGKTFTSYPTGVPNDLYFKDSVNGIGVEEASIVLKTLNGGLNWGYNVLAVSGNFYRVSFINENTGFTASTRAVYSTNNFGINWDSVGRITPLDIDVTSIEFCNENTGWAGTTSPVYKTTNGGRDWFLQILTGVVYSIYSYNDSLVWTCGNAGRIWHTTNGGTSSIQTISNEIPEEFQLNQNYPNPFNSQTKITFNIKHYGKYSMVIFNNLGQKIIEVFSDKLAEGVYETTFDASDLNSGVYFYRLTGNNISLTKKFVLIK